MIPNIKEKLKWEQSESKQKMLKGIGQLVALVLFCVLVFLWIQPSGTKKEQPKAIPTTFQSKPTETAPVPFKEPPSFSGGINKKEEGFANDLVEVLMANTTGSYTFPDKAEKKLRIVVEDLFKDMQQEIFEAYKGKRVNISKLDTMSNPELYKILE